MTANVANTAWRFESLHLQWDNDYMSIPPNLPHGRRYDDDGFTNGLQLDASIVTAAKDDLSAPGYSQLRLHAVHNMITERGGMRRVDDVQVALHAAHTWRWGSFSLTGSVLAAVNASGNLAGASVQDTFHRHAIHGRQLDGSGRGQLQFEYDAKARTGVGLGARVEARYDVAPSFQLSAGVSGEQAFGDTGVSRMVGEAGLTWRPLAGWTRGDVANVVDNLIRVEASLVGSHFDVRDPWLSIPGGYVVGEWHAMPRARVMAHLWGVDVGFEQRLNEGGAGHHTAGIVVGGSF